MSTPDTTIKIDEGTIAMNIAYMMLYTTWREGEACWPFHHFERPGSMANIEPLLAFGHAEVFGAGYRITAEGRAYWEDHRERWIQSTTRGTGVRTDSHATQLLMFLRDGRWHLTSSLPAALRNSARYELLNSHATEQTVDAYHRTCFRITPHGWKRLLKLHLVSAADEPVWDTHIAKDESA